MQAVDQTTLPNRKYIVADAGRTLLPINRSLGDGHEWSIRMHRVACIKLLIAGQDRQELLFVSYFLLRVKDTLVREILNYMG